MRFPSSVLLVCLSLSGCGSDDTSASQESGTKCDYPQGEVAYAEQSKLGYAPQAVLEPLLGDHTCTWTWNDILEQEVPASTFTISPGDVAATLTFSLGSEPITYTQDHRPGDGNGAFGGCADVAASAPVSLGIHTDDGVIDDDFALDVGLYLSRSVEGESAIDASQLEGYGFSWDASWQDKGLFLSIRAENGKLTGQLFQRAQKPFNDGIVADTLAITGSFTCD